MGDTPDNSILSGGDPSGAPDISTLTGPSTPQPSAPPIPQQAPADPTAAPAAQAPAQAPATPVAAGQPSVWKNLVLGAIAGLAGSAGSTHFGGGLAQGAAGAINEQQRQIQNKNTQQQLNFESVKAADDHIRALNEARQADQLNANEKIDYKQKSADYQNFLQDNFGIEPDLSFNDSHTDAIAALNTASARNPSGQIPPVVTVHQPEADGTHGSIAAYSPSQQQMQQNSSGFLKLANTGRAAQGLPDFDATTWNSMGFKGQRDAAQGALSYLKPTVSFSLDKGKPDYLPVVLAQRQQQLQTYENHKDINGKADADPTVAKQLQAGVDYLQSAWDKGNSMESAQAQQSAGASEQGRLNVQNQPQNVAAEAARKGADARAMQAAAQGSPEEAGKMLANGSLTLADLKSRGTTPDFIIKASKAAQNLTGGKYNPSDEIVGEQSLKQAGNQTFYGSANSLLDQGGTLDQLQSAGAKLGSTAIPKFNSVDQWKQAATGKGAVAGFAQTALGVADDYAKVMGGGQGSDSAREEVLKSIAAAQSPEQRASAIQAARDAVNSQLKSRIGGNNYIKQRVGQNIDRPPAKPSGVPANATWNQESKQWQLPQ